MHDVINKVNLDIGRRIHAARLKADMSLAQLSARAELPISDLQAVESGTVRAGAILVARIARVLELEIRTFFVDSCTMQDQPSITLIKTAKSTGLFADLIRAEHRKQDGQRAA